jgi:ABC-type multidrug transport system fused ATPase/permease subunit
VTTALRIWRQLDRQAARRIAAALAATLLLAPIELVAVALVVPLLDLFSGGADLSSGITGRLADWTGVDDPNDLALLLGAVIVLLFVVRSVTTLVVRWWTLGTLFDAERDAASRLLRGYLDEPYERHLNRNSAEILRTLQISVDQTYGGYVASALTMAAEALVAASLVVLLLVVQPVPTLLLGAYFGVVGPLYMRTVQRRAYSAGATMQDLSRDSILVARDALDGVKELVVLQRQEELIRRFGGVRERTADARRWMQFLREAPRYIIEILFLLGVTVLLGGLALTSSSAEVITTLGVFIAAGFRLMPPLGRLVSAHASMRASAPGVEIVMDELERFEREPTSEAHGDGPAPLQRELTFDHVTFTHDGAERPSLRDVSVVIRPGESVAVVGPSGAGKTTFVDLVLGLHAPTSGSLTVDGVPLEDCLAGWRATVGYVPQDVFLVDASLRENVAFGVPLAEIDDAAVDRAVRGAQLTDLVQQLEQGLHGVVGERGVRLSGGQRQRIGIARALYGDPTLLILDEATSALDSDTEARISETISELRSHMTVIAIAHRLSTLRDFERVLFLKDGVLAGDGSFLELQQRDADFARLLAQANLDLSER